jgi:hypothetical protein
VSAPADADARLGARVERERLERRGAPWFPVGVNYHPASVGVGWLRTWRPGEIATDLDGMASAGLDCVRIFVYWADVEPDLGDHDPVVLDRLRQFGALAAERGIGVVASVLTIWMNGQRFLPPWFGDRLLWRDPVAIGRAEAVAAAVAGALATSGADVVYDLGDEIPNVDPRSHELTRAEVATWQARLARAIRAAHPGAPVLQANEPSAVFGRHPFGPDNRAGLDLAGLHGFPLWGPASIGGHGSPLASRLVPFLVRYARAFGPVLVDEIGAYLASPEVTAEHLRATLPAVAAAGAAGVIAWSWTDIAAPGRPFDERPSERTTGVVARAGRPRPALAVLTDLARQAPALWSRAEVPSAPVGLFVPERAREPELTYLQATTPDGLALFHADVLASRAQLPTEIVRAPAPHHRLIVSPAAGRLTERDIAALRDAVEAGATLLASLGDPLHGFPGPDLTGTQLVDFTPGTRHAELTVDGTTFPVPWRRGARAAVVAAADARVVARFADGTPALTRHRLGAGEVWLLAAPLEALLDDPDTFDAAPWHRLYRRVAEEAGAMHGLAWCPEPDVQICPLRADGRRVAVVVNHAAEPVTVELQGDTWPAGEAFDLAPKSAAVRYEPTADPGDEVGAPRDERTTPRSSLAVTS